MTLSWKMETSNGCRPTDSGAGPRIRLLVPLLVAFKNAEMKQQVMMNVRNLETTIVKFRGIGISHDLNPKERYDIKHMIRKQSKHMITSVQMQRKTADYWW